MINQIVTLDFETLPIGDRPDYPPQPVGLAIKEGSSPSDYLSFGHPSGNTSTREEVVARLADIIESGRPVLFHNAKFDLAVMEEALNLPKLPWYRVHDTMFLMFLSDPHARALDLKSAAEHLLDWPPEERDACAMFVWAHRKQLKEQYGLSIGKDLKSGKDQATKSATGAYLSLIPADIVEPYARGDVDRTHALFAHLYKDVMQRGMRKAYDRERQILPILMENERIGMRVDTELLERDVEGYKGERDLVDDWLRKRLNSPSLNIDSDRDFAYALADAGIIKEENWTYTKSGQRSVSKKNLTPDLYEDPRVAAAYGYRNRLGTTLKMFMEPWLEQSSKYGGYVTTNWNQTRGGDGGTRTGRPSTSRPNFLNISKSLENRGDGYEHPDFLDVESLPMVRDYVLPDEGQVFVHRDFNGQELRVFAHFECGELWEAYQSNPKLDVHGLVGKKMSELAKRDFERSKVKIINFQSLYGGGVSALQKELDVSYDEALEFKRYHDKALPGRVLLNKEIKRLTSLNIPITTWGGRKYLAEKPQYKQGRMMDFGYKLINYLIQGSAADATKEALIRWYNHPDRPSTDRFLVTVYDEINISASPDTLHTSMRVLRECMEGLEFDIPMLSEPKLGWSWGTCVKPSDGEDETAFIDRFLGE